MTNEERREFLKRLARGAVYAAPVIHSLAAPLDLVGQGTGASKKEGHGLFGAPTQQQAPSTQPGGEAPWERPPPGGRRP